MIYPIKHSNSTNYLCSLDTLIFVYCIWPAVQTHHSFHPFSHLFQHYLLISDRHKFSSLISIHDIAQCLLAYCYGDSIPFFVFLLHCSSFLMASNLNISHHFQGPFWWALPYYHLFYRWWWSVMLTSLPKFSSFQLSFLFSGSEESVKAEQNPCEICLVTLLPSLKYCFSIPPVRKLDNEQTAMILGILFMLPYMTEFFHLVLLLSCLMPRCNHFKQWWCLSFVLLCVTKFSSTMMIPRNNTHMNILLPFSWQFAFM